jgi:hypothetical protein
MALTNDLVSIISISQQIHRLLTDPTTICHASISPAPFTSLSLPPSLHLMRMAVNQSATASIPWRPYNIRMPHSYKSSFRFATLSPITKEDLRKARHIISHIIDNPESGDFR